VQGAAFLVFLLSGCIGFGIGDVAFYQALPRLGSRLSVLVVLCLSSPLGGLVEWYWLGAALKGPEIFWGAVILAGVAVALSPGRGEGPRHAQWGKGLLFALLAALCQALGAVLSRKGFAIATLAGQSIDGISAAYQRILGGVIIAALAMLLVRSRPWRRAPGNKKPPLESRPRPRAWPWVVANAMAGSVIGVSCFQYALKTTPTGVVLPIVAITPIVIIPFSQWIEGERPSRRSLAGGIAAVIGAVALAASR
jgi:drug/metabolite transporter (DMT)-like permease